MFFMLLIMFMLTGSIIMMLPLMLPGYFIDIVFYGLQIMGLMIQWIGVLLYASRSVVTGANILNELPKPMEVLCLHEKRGGTARLRRGKLDILDHIKLKEMIFKDTGGGFRVAGHRIVHTKETVNHIIPDWIAQYIHQVSQKYMVDNPEKLKKLYDALKKLKRPMPGIISLEDQLHIIPELELVMKDEDRKQVLLNMSLENLQNMSELLYDGQMVHMEDYEKFQEAASPYDLESYTKKHEIHRMMQWFHYKDINAPDWMKYVIIIFVLLIAGAIAYQIFGG
jgi:hypothetical protein